MKIQQTIKIFGALLKNTAFMSLAGVIIGGSITGYFTYKSQQEIISSQKFQFQLNYKIEQNKVLKENLNKYINLLSEITTANLDKPHIDKIFTDMFSISIQISLLGNRVIGDKCFWLTTELEKRYRSGEESEIHKIKLIKMIEDWMKITRIEINKIDLSVEKYNSLIEPN